MTLSIEEKIGQMFIIGFHGLEPPQWVLDMLKDGQIGGVVLFGRNIANPEQLAKLTSTCHAAAKYPILIAIDQEGGLVARLREKDGFTESPGAMTLGAGDSEEMAERVSAVLAKELRALGINWNLAPVVDITHDINNPSVGTRSLGSDKRRVGRLSSAQIRGFQNEQVAASAKHFPGIGNTPVDTHQALAVIDGDVNYLWEHDLVPFRNAVKAKVETVMVSHVKFTALDPEYPATLSSAISQELLRDEIGFEGVACTDCMEMGAIRNNYGAEESAVLAAIAGQDMIMFSHSFNDDSTLYPRIFEALVDAAKTGRIPMADIDSANQRIKALKERVAIIDAPNVANLRHASHQKTMQEAAQAGIVLLKDDNHLLPIKPDDNRSIALVEFGSYLDTPAIESGENTALASIFNERFPNINCIGLKSYDVADELIESAKSLAQSADILLLATRSAHINTLQIDISKDLIPLAKNVIFLCLRNPYDVDVIHDTDAILCSCGDSTPSLHAIVDALEGVFTPTGKLPVPVNI